MTGALKEKSLLAQSGRLDVPHTVEHRRTVCRILEPGRGHPQAITSSLCSTAGSRRLHPTESSIGNGDR